MNNNNDNVTNKELILKNESQNNNILRLLRLPIDLIFKTSLYLDEKDIYKFEKCCKLFYQIINNSSYLNQSNTFKSFSLEKEQLEVMTQSKNSSINIQKQHN